MLYLNFLLITLVYIIYCIIIYFSSVDIDNLNILLKTPHLRVADIILSAVSSPSDYGDYGGLVCWSLTSLCHSNRHIETMPAREINPFTALTRIRYQLLRTQ